MAIFKSLFQGAFAALAALLAVTQASMAGDLLPLLGRDSVLVWKMHGEAYDSDFVVRIAEFSPDRFLEWEDSTTQGTVFIPHRDILAAKGYVSTSLFSSGVDSRGSNLTTLWLSRQIFLDLKEKKKVKCDLDGTVGSLTYRGDGQLTVEVNRSSRELPVIKVSDGRGSERWFLDQEDNPLLVRHTVREFSQTLISITTDQPNTLRWIKGRKLSNLPH